MQLESFEADLHFLFNLINIRQSACYLPAVHGAAPLLHRVMSSYFSGVFPNSTDSGKSKTDTFVLVFTLLPLYH